MVYMKQWLFIFTETWTFLVRKFKKQCQDYWDWGESEKVFQMASIAK